MSDFKMTPVVSSHIKEIGHDGKATLRVTYFKGGKTFDYCPVTQAQFHELSAADSKGKWLHQNVKDNENTKCIEVKN